MTTPAPDIWTAFSQTVLELSLDPPVAFAVTEPMPQAVRTAADAAAPGMGLAVVTSCNPDGINVSESDNAEATNRLRAALVARNLTPCAALGRSADGSHQEPGFLIECTRDEARDLAHEWRQLAVFFIDPEGVWLIPADPRFRDKRLAS